MSIRRILAVGIVVVLLAGGFVAFKLWGSQAGFADPMADYPRAGMLQAHFNKRPEAFQALGEAFERHPDLIEPYDGYCPHPKCKEEFDDLFDRTEEEQARLDRARAVFDPLFDALDWKWDMVVNQSENGPIVLYTGSLERGRYSIDVEYEYWPQRPDDVALCDRPPDELETWSCSFVLSDGWALVYDFMDIQAIKTIAEQQSACWDEGRKDCEEEAQKARDELFATRRR